MIWGCIEVGVKPRSVPAMAALSMYAPTHGFSNSYSALIRCEDIQIQLSPSVIEVT